jgi:acetolactate synthase-1/2/3 large subunit
MGSTTFDEPPLDQLRWPGHHGCGLTYAMGIKLPKPIRRCSASPAKARCRCASGLSTCLQYNTPIKIVSLNNRYLGMVRQVAGNQIFEDYSSYMDAFLIREAG